jgi:hypothetical protein
LRSQSLCNILSDDRIGLSFTIAAGNCQRIHSQARVPRDSLSHFTVSDSRLTQFGGQVPVFISPRNMVALLYPQALGSLAVAFYDSQGYGGGDSNPPPHPGGPVCCPLTHKFETDRIQNTAPNSASNFCVYIRCRAGMNWSSRVLCYDRRSAGQSAPEQSTHLKPTIRFPPLSVTSGLSLYSLGSDHSTVNTAPVWLDACIARCIATVAARTTENTASALLAACVLRARLAMGLCVTG